MARHRKKSTNKEEHYFKSRPGVTIEVRLYDEIWNKFYDERASVGDRRQMNQLMTDLKDKGIDLERFK